MFKKESNSYEMFKYPVVTVNPAPVSTLRQVYSVLLNSCDRPHRESL